MSVVKTVPISRPNATMPVHLRVCRRACLTYRWIAPSEVVVSAYGEADAANAHEFVDYCQHCMVHCRRLFVDLRGLDFFGTAGLSALHTIDARCADAGVDWAVVPGAAVRRLLRVCPGRALPTVDSPGLRQGRREGA